MQLRNVLECPDHCEFGEPHVSMGMGVRCLVVIGLRPSFSRYQVGCIEGLTDPVRGEKIRYPWEKKKASDTRPKYN